MLTACGSTKVNTAQSRFYQAFITRFNVYHNGHEAYKEGLDAQEKSHKDNYMEIIPLFNISKESTRSAGSGSFDVRSGSITGGNVYLYPNATFNASANAQIEAVVGNT